MAITTGKAAGKLVAGLFAAVLGMAGLFASAASAYEPIGPDMKEYPYFDERLSVTLGGMHPFMNTQIQVNGAAAGPGTLFDFETDLGLEGDVVTFFGNANYRIGKHASLGLTYLDVSRSSTRTLAKTIQFKDRTFDLNTTVNAFVNTKFYLLNYQYSFVRNTHNEFGGSFGLNILDISTGMSSVGTLAGPSQTVGGSRGNEVSFVAPIPLVGFYFTSQFLPKTFVRNSVQYLDVNIAGFAAKSLNYMIAVDYNPWKNFGIGAGVYANRIQIDKGTSLEGRFVYNITGTQVYLRYFI